MGGSGRKWLKGCGLGCATVAALGVAGMIVSGVFLGRSFDGAVDSQRELTRALGAREAWTPPVDGPAPDRLEAFLAVRRELAPFCADFTAAADRFRTVEELDKQDEVSATEALRAVAPVMGAVAGMMGDIGRFTEARNRALLAQGMSLGEYAWLYVLIYNAWLGLPPDLDPDDLPEDAAYGDRERALIATLLGRQADALAAAGRTAEAELWRSEADGVAGSATGVPFLAEGLPADLAARFEPWRDELAAAWCGATGSIELGEVHKQGLSIRAD